VSMWKVILLGIRDGIGLAAVLALCWFAIVVAQAFMP
jgi:hypothetical protein